MAEHLFFLRDCCLILKFERCIIWPQRRCVAAFFLQPCFFYRTGIVWILVQMWAFSENQAFAVTVLQTTFSNQCFRNHSQRFSICFDRS